MGTVAFLNVLRGNSREGFDVSLQVCKDNASSAPIDPIQGKLSASTRIQDLHILLLHKLNRLGRQRGSDNDWHIEDRPTNVSTSEENECRDLFRQLEDITKKWLKDPGLQTIRDKLNMEIAKTSGEFLLIITAYSSPEVYNVLWYNWDLIEQNANVNLVFRFPSDGEPEPSTTNYQNQVRILVTLGDSRDINTELDRDAIRQLNADPTFLEQPTSRRFTEHLRQRSGWHIFCFSGHSETIGDKGRIYLNETEFLEISDFRNALREARRNNLEIAIFNSCDGLGLAQQLAHLHIPFVIVMRERVPDEVAQQFLKDFLTEYANGESLYTSFRRARERLENLFPGATGLPMMFQNTTKEPPPWQGLRHPKRKGQILPSWRLRFLPMLLLSVVVIPFGQFLWKLLVWLALAIQFLVISPHILQVPQDLSQSQVELNTLVGKWNTTWSVNTTTTKMNISENKRLDSMIAVYTFSNLNDKNHTINGKIYGQLIKQGKVLIGWFNDETGKGLCSFVLSSNGYSFQGQWFDITGQKGQWIGKGRVDRYPPKRLRNHIVTFTSKEPLLSFHTQRSIIPR